MENKERYFKALIDNKGHLNEMDLGENIGLEENEIRQILVQLLAEHKIKYKFNRNCNYKI